MVKRFHILHHLILFAGEVKFQNEVNFIKEKFEYKLVWKDSIIFPQLESTDKVRIDTVEAERGQILDRNGKVLAGKGCIISWASAG